MGFLTDHFHNLKPEDEECDEVCFGSKGFLQSWNHDNEGMSVLLQALDILRPRVVIELGTFEGLGTDRIAKKMDEIGQKSFLYTFDVGTHPFGGAKKIDWQREPNDTWRSWEDVIKMRNERLSKKYKSVTVEFIEGITFDTLGPALERIGEWDFCFQDSDHYPDYVAREWKLLKPYSKIGSVIVFDDMQSGIWVETFRRGEPDWATVHSNTDRKPLWAERIK